MRRVAVCVMFLFAAGPRADTHPALPSHARAVETALDRYVAAPDSHFSFSAVAGLAATGRSRRLDRSAMFPSPPRPDRAGVGAKEPA